MPHDALIADAESILTQAASSARPQAHHTLTPLQQFYVSLLETGRLPNSKPSEPEVAMTRDLLAEARKQWPLRNLNWTALGRFLRRQQGVVKYREIAANGWRFRKLPEARQAWERQCGKWNWPLESGTPQNGDDTFHTLHRQRDVVDLRHGDRS